MNPADNLLRYAMADDAATPALIDEQSDNLMYLGYPLDSCAGFDDPKWLIKRVLTVTLDDGSRTKVISFANGSRRHNQAWTERKTLSYPVTSSFATMTDEDLRAGLE